MTLLGSLAPLAYPVGGRPSRALVVCGRMRHDRLHALAACPGVATLGFSIARHGARIVVRRTTETDALRYDQEGRALMIRTVEAVVYPSGNVRLLEDIQLPGPRRALVTILDDAPGSEETALLSERALADWSRPEEDAAWSHLQPAG